MRPHPVHLKEFRSIPGLHLSDADSASTSLHPTTHPLWQPEMGPDIAKCPLGDKITLRWKTLIYIKKKKKAKLIYGAIG